MATAATGGSDVAVSLAAAAGWSTALSQAAHTVGQMPVDQRNTATEAAPRYSAAVSSGADAASLLSSEDRLAAVAGRILQRGPLAEVSPPEQRLLRGAQAAGIGEAAAGAVREQITAGGDPLGDAFLALRSPAERRGSGAVYTPEPIVDSMVAWLGRRPAVGRIVDPGAGSGRFALAAGRAFDGAHLVAVESDPLALLLLRANLTAAGLAVRSEVVAGDYRRLRLDGRARHEAPTAFIGNPPYVRHHLIERRWKQWLGAEANRLGLPASGLAGLHVHFFLQTALLAAPGDLGTFVTSAEWLDVNYGKLVRALLVRHLGVESIHLVDPSVLPFGDVATTAAITCFRVGRTQRAVGFRKVAATGDLGALEGGRSVGRQQMQAASRWTPLLAAPRRRPEGYVELGELCRVHRGAVTGANATWITSRDDATLPATVLFPAVTRARELFDAGDRLDSLAGLRCVIDLPEDLDELDPSGRRSVERFLRAARARDVHEGYIARHRRCWWSVGLRCPPPIIATYMARRPPAFVRNPAGAHHINVAHGLYPREPMTPAILDRLAGALSTTVTTAGGRIYAGGLAKFEPSEMARLAVPSVDLLANEVAA